MEFADDPHLDVLQNIEFAVIEVYRADPDLLDAEVDRALMAAIVAFNARRVGKEFDVGSAKLTPRGLEVFTAVMEVCEWRGSQGFARDPRLPPGHGAEAVLVTCLQRIQKSLRRWTKKDGKRGYLEFVKDYLP